MNLFKKTRSKPEMVGSIEELLKELPNWSIREKRPSKFWNRGKDFIQVVLLSKVTGMKSLWCEKDGLSLLRIGNRAYQVPKENLYGDIFIYDNDKKQSITELISVDKQDAEDSFHELQMFNMAYSVGRQAGANDLLNKLGTVMICIIGILLLEIIIAGLVYIKTKDLLALTHSIQATLAAIQSNLTG